LSDNCYFCPTSEKASIVDLLLNNYREFGLFETKADSNSFPSLFVATGLKMEKNNERRKEL
jgi:hypothetical protein